MDPVSFKTWNTRYVAYARAHGRTPEEMLVYDAACREGGTFKEGGFVVWVSRRWREWAAAHGVHPGDTRDHHHEAFDAWLEERGKND